MQDIWELAIQSLWLFYKFNSILSCKVYFKKLNGGLAEQKHQTAYNYGNRVSREGREVAEAGKNIWRNNGQKLLKPDERYEYTHPRISMNSNQDKLKEIHTETYYSQIIKTLIKRIVKVAGEK